MNFVESIDYVESLDIFGVRLGLERIIALAEKLGNPQNEFASVHVTGTNGKGSTCAMLAEIFQQAGYKVGLFTSPHLESYCERMKINGENISENEFAEIITQIKNLNVEASLFETLTAAAFAWFAKENINVAVVEVGLGGTLDSTNIILPKVSVITNVALDHMKVLGDLKSIARNKAGIIKKNIPVVTGATGEPLEIIREVAKKNNSPIYEVTEPTKVKINLLGEYQKFNAAIAIQTAKVLGISEEKILQGLEKVTWAGRFEIFDTEFGKIIIDGAHNPHGIKAFRESLDKYFPEGRRNFVFGALADKNIEEMIKILFREEDFVIVTEPNSPRAETTENLCKKLENIGIKNFGEKNNLRAVDKLKKCDGLKIIVGSLYLIGEIRKIFAKK